MERGESVTTTEEAKIFLSDMLDSAYQEALKRVDTEDLDLLESVKDCGIALIDKITIEREIDKRTFWERFMVRLYQEPLELFNTLTQSVISEVETRLQVSDNTEDIFICVQKLAFLSSRDFWDRFVALQGIIISRVDDLREILENFMYEPDQDAISFLDDFREIVRTKEILKKSFIVLRVIGDAYHIIGAEIEDDRLLKLGIISLTAICTRERFRAYIQDAGLESRFSNGEHIVEVEGRLEDYYPDSFTDTSLYPDELFLLLCATHERMGAFLLTDTKIGNEVKVKIQQ